MHNLQYGWFANPVYHPEGNYPQIMIDRIGNRSKAEGFKKSRLPTFTTEEIDYLRGTYDFLALNSYTTNYVQWAEDYGIGFPSLEADMSVSMSVDPNWEGSTALWLKVVPWGMRKLLNWVDQKYDHPEIIITENGYSDDGRFNDTERINYISASFDQYSKYPNLITFFRNT